MFTIKIYIYICISLLKKLRHVSTTNLGIDVGISILIRKLGQQEYNRTIGANVFTRSFLKILILELSHQLNFFFYI